MNRSTLYVPQNRDRSDRAEASKVDELLASNPFYGHRRVAICFGWSSNKARRIMRKYRIYPTFKKPRFILKTADINQPPQPYQNHIKLLQKDNTITGITKPNTVWSTDFTYIKYKSSFLYVATVIDTYSKDIVGFHISNRHTTNLISKALNMALRKHNKPQYHHSDQGSEYRSYVYIDYLKKNGITVSMSKKASPWENGYQESFYGKFKQELGNVNQYDSEIELIEAIVLQIHYYNNKRIHTAIRDIPSLFRQKELEKIEMRKCTEKRI